MPVYNKSYSDYLGAKKCCCKGVKGANGPPGPPGPSGSNGSEYWNIVSDSINLTLSGTNNAEYNGSGYTGIGYTGDVIINGNLLVKGGTGNINLNTQGNLILTANQNVIIAPINGDIIFPENLVTTISGPPSINFLKIMVNGVAYKIQLNEDTY